MISAIWEGGRDVSSRSGADRLRVEARGSMIPPPVARKFESRPTDASHSTFWAAGCSQPVVGYYRARAGGVGRIQGAGGAGRGRERAWWRGPSAAGPSAAASR